MSKSLWTIVSESLTEVINGVPKGSGKAICALFSMLSAMSMVVMSFIPTGTPAAKTPIDHWAFGTLLGFIAAVYGIKAVWGKEGSQPPPTPQG